MRDPTPRNIELAKRVVFDSTHAEMAVLYALALDDLSERDRRIAELDANEAQYSRDAELADATIAEKTQRIAELEAEVSALRHWIGSRQGERFDA